MYYENPKQIKVKKHQKSNKEHLENGEGERERGGGVGWMSDGKFSINIYISCKILLTQ